MIPSQWSVWIFTGILEKSLYAITTFDKPVWISGPADKISFW